MTFVLMPGPKPGRIRSPEEVATLKDRVIEAWCDGLDTMDISERLGAPEPWCLYVINRWRDMQRATGTAKGQTK